MARYLGDLLVLYEYLRIILNQLELCGNYNISCLGLLLGFLPRPLVWANIPCMYVTMKLRFVEIHFTYNTDYVWEIFLRYLQVHNAVTSILMVWEDSGLTLEVP